MVGSGRAVAAGKTVFYQGVGDRLTRWDIDVDTAALTQRDSVALPSNIQYAWPHPSRKSLYVTTSDAASGNAPNPGKVHRLCALRIGADGGLSMLGEPAALPQRPIHNSVDSAGQYAFTAYNNPSNLTVHRINADGSMGEQMVQPAKLDVGVFAHQILPTPSNNSVVLVTRGNKAESGKPEDPGALKIYDFKDGQLSPRVNLPVGGKGGLGYGPRHLDFHRTQPWVYVSVESQNELHMHRLEGDVLSAEPVYKKRTTAAGYEIEFPQAAGGVHIHPNGRTVYVSNRANATVDFNGKRVFRGGENNIAVFSIDQNTGEPMLIQNAESQSFHVRTFSIDPSGKIMIAASIAGIDVREGDDIRRVPAALTVFRILDDGKLQFVRKLDVDVGGKFQWWTGFVDLA
jgi:6-phosphogluconolactonase (cycloisomerase 2 family)